MTWILNHSKIFMTPLCSIWATTCIDIFNPTSFTTLLNTFTMLNIENLHHHCNCLKSTVRIPNHLLSAVCLKTFLYVMVRLTYWGDRLHYSAQASKYLFNVLDLKWDSASSSFNLSLFKASVPSCIFWKYRRFKDRQYCFRAWLSDFLRELATEFLKAENILDR